MYVQCVAVVINLRQIEIKLVAHGIHRIAKDVMDDMRQLHYVLTIRNKDRNPSRRMETPSKTQTEALSAFSHRVEAGGVLQPVSA